MVLKYVFGSPFQTESVVCFPEDGKVFENEKNVPFGKLSLKNGFSLSVPISDETLVFGLGEAMGGINKRGRIYRSWCSDEPNQVEDKESLYGAHNFLMIYNPKTKKCFALFIDYPSLVTYDVGFTFQNEIKILAEKPDLNLYFIEADRKSGKTPHPEGTAEKKSENNPEEISSENVLYSTVKIFRKMIGKSYLPPLWAFGFMQSRWGYGSENDLEEVYENFRKHKIPLDAIFLDIDYMKDFRDFTVDEKKFKDFGKTVRVMKERNVHIVPIVDAGIPSEPEKDETCRTGIEKGFFCRMKDSSFFKAGVWPGLSVFPDFLDPEAGKWFSSNFERLTSKGIEGFWIDMNEPALFYSEQGVFHLISESEKTFKEIDRNFFSLWHIKDEVLKVQNRMEDYRSFYHKVPKRAAGGFSENFSDEDKLKNTEDFSYVRHDLVHNLYGFRMTKCVSEFLSEKLGKNSFLLFSRASFTGSHRFAGIWTGDNCSWWSHLELFIKQLPSLNMLGFIYSGCDLGGFGGNVSRELLLRFLGIGVFTPLMRNHSALGTRGQEFYKFENPEDFADLVSFRYRIIPYLYAEAEKCAEEGKMLFRPLSFDYENDDVALRIEDQLMLCDDLMIAPVYKPNASGRFVYIPEEMTMFRCTKEKGLKTGEGEKTSLSRGSYYIQYEKDEIVFFMKKGRRIPVFAPAENTASLDRKTVEFWKG